MLFKFFETIKRDITCEVRSAHEIELVMALRSVCSRCKQACLVDGFPLVRGRRVKGVRCFSDGHKGYPLPWPHNTAPIITKEPLWNKWAGLFLLRRVIKQRTGQPFAMSEFFFGVKEAILAFTNALKQTEQRSNLGSFLHPSLHSAVEESLAKLPEGAQIQLDVENIRNMQLTSANSIVGTAPPGDEHVIAWIGQKIISSKSKLGDVMKPEEGNFTFEKARELGREAAYNRLEFQLTVSFVTRERFLVLDKVGHIVAGFREHQDSHHLWKFASVLDWDSDYPFQWKVIDINNYVLHSH